MSDEMTGQEFADYMTGFERRLDGRFIRMDRRLDGIDSRLERMDDRIETVVIRLEKIETRFDSVEVRLESVETRIESVQTRLDGVEGRVENVQTRLESLETRIGARLDRHDERFVRLEGRLDELKQSVATQLDAVRSEVRLALEGIAVLSERTDRAFAELRAEFAGRTLPIETAVREVSRRPASTPTKAKRVRKRGQSPH